MPRLGDRRRHDADPRRPRLRDRAVARRARRGADPGRAHDARLPHQQDLRGLDRDHAPLHGARGGGQAPAGRRRADRSRQAAAARSSRALPEDRRVLRLVVPDALARLGLLAALRRVRRRSRPTCASSSARRAGSRGELPRHARLPGASCRTSRRFLFRLVDIANELFAMAASVPGRRRSSTRHAAEADEARRLADLFCRSARRKVRALSATSGATTTPSLQARRARAPGRRGLARGRGDAARAAPRAGRRPEAGSRGRGLSPGCGARRAPARLPIDP